MEGVLDYRLNSSQGQINVSDSASQKAVTHTVSGLSNGTKYSFTIFAVFENIQSNGTEHTAATGELLLFSLCCSLRQWAVRTLNYPPLFSPVPPRVTGVKVTERTMTSVGLEWNGWKGWTYVLWFQGKNETFWTNNCSYQLSGLQPGTEYNFSVVTNFFKLNSKAYESFVVTSKKILIIV